MLKQYINTLPHHRHQLVIVDDVTAIQQIPAVMLLLVTIVVLVILKMMMMTNLAKVNKIFFKIILYVYIFPIET